MIYIVGAIMILIGIGMLVRLLIFMQHPRAEAVVKAVTMEYPAGSEKVEAAGAPIRKFPHGVVEYYYGHDKYERKILLKTKKAQPGDSIKVSIKPKNPTFAEEFNPKTDIFAIAVTTGIGITLIALCEWIMEKIG